MKLFIKGISLAWLTLFFAFTGLSYAQSEWGGVDRIVAVGDVHGDYDNFRQVLRDAELINRRGNWIGGETHLVQVGDIPDRGPDTHKIIELVKKLQEQALDDGGMVHPLIGNHEAMNMLGDLRYVHPGEYSALRGSRSRSLQSRYYDAEVERLKSNDPAFEADDVFRRTWLDQHPLGYVEHRLAWRPNGEFGSWVVENNTVIKINRTLFLHAGLSESLLDKSLDEINQQIRAELAGGLGEEPGLSEAQDGPLWFRGLASPTELIDQNYVDRLLQAFDVDRIVVGHTPGRNTIYANFADRVIVIDSGISEHYGGNKSSLHIRNDEVYALQDGEKTYFSGDGASALSP